MNNHDTLEQLLDILKFIIFLLIFVTAFVFALISCEHIDDDMELQQKEALADQE